MLKVGISVIFKVGIEMQNSYHVIELDSLNNFYSVKFSRKGLVWPVRLSKVCPFCSFWPNSPEITRFCATIQVERGPFEKILLSKIFSRDHCLASKTIFVSLSQFWKLPKSQPSASLKGCWNNFDFPKIKI